MILLRKQRRKNKERVLVHKFNLPVFKAKVFIIIGKTMMDAFNWLEDATCEVIEKPKDKRFIKAYMYGYKTEKNTSEYALLFKYTATPGMVAHETKHLINTVFLWHGHKASLTNDEMECYYLEDIVNRVHNTLKRARKNFKSYSKNT